MEERVAERVKNLKLGFDPKWHVTVGYNQGRRRAPLKLMVRVSQQLEDETQAHFAMQGRCYRLWRAEQMQTILIHLH
jgi:hypothetical protein